MDNPEQDRDKGVGLGLSIVNAVVSMLDQHRIELKSTEGRGSHFSLEMPLCGPAIDKPSGRAPQRSEADETAQLSGRYVLLVEDDGLVRASTEALLSQWVCCTTRRRPSKNTRRFWRASSASHLIITDFRLRDFKTAREVAMASATKLGRACPCLVVTGEPTATLMPLACDHDVLSKPVSPAELRREMVTLIAGADTCTCEPEAVTVQ